MKDLYLFNFKHTMTFSKMTCIVMSQNKRQHTFANKYKYSSIITRNQIYFLRLSRIGKLESIIL